MAKQILPKNEHLRPFMARRRRDGRNLPAGPVLPGISALHAPFSVSHKNNVANTCRRVVRNNRNIACVRAHNVSRNAIKQNTGNVRAISKKRLASDHDEGAALAKRWLNRHNSARRKHLKQRILGHPRPCVCNHCHRRHARSAGPNLDHNLAVC